MNHLGGTAPLCRQVVGVPAGGLMRGDEHECGRAATLMVRDAGTKKLIALVCNRHAVRFRRMPRFIVNDLNGHIMEVTNGY